MKTFFSAYHSIFKHFLFFLTISSLVSCKPTQTTNRPNDFYNITWNLNAINGKSLPKTTLESAIPSIQFQTDSNFFGFTGCNRFSGRYIKRQSISSFEPGAMTKMYCEGSMENEFLDLLQQSNQISIEGYKLLLLKDNKILLSFVKKN